MLKTTSNKPIKIIESGTGYVKFSDGTLICYGTCNTTINIDMSSGNIYYGYFSNPVSFPVAFTETPICNFCNYNANNKAIIVGSFIANNKGVSNLSLISAIIRTHENVTINYIAIGRWK